jgi:hypothetical protein
MQLSLTRLSILAATLGILAGCASTQQQNAPAASSAAATPGKHLVYRDNSGNVVRQFDYPDDSFCRRVEAMAGRSARCQAEPAAGFTARATLRYNPPGVLVHGHYADMNRCRTDTATMAPGVQLVEGCTAR